MAEIIPALLGTDTAVMGGRAELVAPLVNWLHLDVADGDFAPLSPGGKFQPQTLDWLPPRPKVEVHLMVARPEEELTHWLALADRVIVHYEAISNLEIMMRAAEQAAVRLSITFLLDTPLPEEADWYRQFDTIQLMAIKKIGYQGQEFDEAVIERVKHLRALSPNVKISIDGGVNLTTAPGLIAAGANALIVGSGLWQSQDPEVTLRQLQQLAPNI